MPKLNINVTLFVVGLVVAANGSIALVVSLLVEKGLLDALIWGGVTLLGLIMVFLTWRPTLSVLMQPRGRRGSDG